MTYSSSAVATWPILRQLVQRPPHRRAAAQVPQQLAQLGTVAHDLRQLKQLLGRIAPKQLEKS